MEELLLCLDLWKVTVCLDLFGDFFFWLGRVRWGTWRGFLTAPQDTVIQHNSALFNVRSCFANPSTGELMFLIQKNGG